MSNVIKSTALRAFIDKAQVVMDYETAIGIRAIAGHTPFRGIGRRAALSIAVGGDDMWEGAAVEFVYPDQSTGEQMTVVSSSVNDTSAGSGTRSIDIHYLDNSGNERTETIVMNGTTPVNTVATNIRFVQYIHTSSVSAIGIVSAGNIIIYRAGDATRIYNVIKVGGNVSLSTQRMIPNGKTFFLNNIKADAVDNKPVSVRLRATCDYEGSLTSNIFIYNEIFELYNSSQSLELKIPRKFPSLCIIKGTAVSTTAGGTCSLSYEGWIE